jgi:NADH-quinone oxidoreductase subunit E
MQAEPKNFSFDEIAEAAIVAAIARYPAGKQASAVMALLDIVQRQMGRQTGSAWVPRIAMDVVGKRLGMAAVRVYEVATFYLMYNTKPVGKYHLQVCTTTPCWLRGSDDIVTACKKSAGIKDFGQTSADGMFTMTEVECLGGCVNAPILQINDDYYEDLDAARTEVLLESLKAGGTLPPAGSTISRRASAPISDQTTLLSTTARREQNDAK